MRHLSLALLLFAAACSDQDFVTDVPLRVVAASPSGNGIDADRSAEITLTFSEKIDPASLEGAIALTSLGLPDSDSAPAPVEITMAYVDDEVPTLTLKPAGKLPFSTVFQVSVSTAVRRARDAAPLPVPVRWTFQTVHPPSLRVERIEPGDQSTGIGRDATIRVTFSEPVDCASLEGNTVLEETFDSHPHTSETGASQTLAGSWSCLTVDPAAPETLDGTQCEANPEACTVTFAPAEANFLYRWSSHVQLTLEGGELSTTPIASARSTPFGGQLEVPHVSRFHVENPAALSVTATAPGAEGRQVPRDAALSLTFSEPPDCASFTAGKVSVTQRFDPHPRLGARAGTEESVPGSWQCASAPQAQQLPSTCATAPELCRVVFQPEAGFLYEWSSDVTLVLKGGAYTPDAEISALDKVESARATSHAGQLPSDITATFHISDPPALALAGMSPADGASGVTRSPVIQLRFSEPPNCASLSDALIVTAESTLDAHPRLAGGTPTALSGAWSCPAPAADAPFACTPGIGSDPCTATFTISPASLPLPASTVVSVELAGGAYAEGQPLTATSLVESTRATTFGGVLPSDGLLRFRIEDPLAQLVAGTTPGNASQEVPVTLPPMDLQVSLAQPVACATVTGSTVTASVVLSDGTPDIYGFAVSCTEGQNGFTLTALDPAQPFPWSATFTVQLAGGPFGQNSPAAWPGDSVESTDATTFGGQLPSDYSFSFRTEDPPPMLVKSVSPSANGTQVALTAPIAVAFTEEIACDSITTGTFRAVEHFATPEDPNRTAAPSANVTCSFTCPAGEDLTVASCDHSGFAKSSRIDVELMGGSTAATSIRSADSTETGGYLQGPPVRYSFRAADPEPLVVTSTAPNGNPGINVSANTDVRFTFDRAIRCETSAALITLVDQTDGSTVAGTSVCTDGASVGGNVNGPTVIFTPSAPLIVEHTYRATAGAGIVAADATIVDGSIEGMLLTSASFDFTVAFENLNVTKTSPSGGSSLVSVASQVAIDFNQDISSSSLVPCTPSVKTGCNIWVNAGSTSDVNAAIDLAFISYDNAGFRIVFDPSDAANAPNLLPDITYVVTLLGGMPGPVGANGVSRLPVDYTWTFRTSSTTLVVGITPEHLATGVEVDDAICVQFADDVNAASLTSGGQNQVVLTYTDAFGRSSAVPLDETTPYTVSGRDGFTSNYVCLNITDAPTACFPGNRRLLYGSSYTATVSTLVEVGATAQTLSDPFQWSFATRSPPEITDIRKKNAVIDETLSGLEGEVPVNTAFVIRFAEEMNAATLNDLNIYVVPMGNSSPVTVTVTPDNAVSARSATVTVSPRMSFLDTAAGTGQYALRLLGGSGGVSTASGNYLGNDLSVPFTTSPITALTISPPESSITPNVAIPVSASRNLHMASLTSETLFATYNGTRISGIIAQQLKQPRAVSYIANPTYIEGQTSAYAFHSTEKVLDLRGNPIPAVSSQLYSTGTTPASNATRAGTATSTAVSPAANGFSADGDQSFLFTHPLGQGIRDRMLGTSYYASEPGESDGTISLESLGGTGCSAEGTRLKLAVRYLPGTTTTTPDRVRIAVASAPYMKGGCLYALKIRQFQTANLYNQAPPTTTCGGAAPPTDIISATLCTSGTPSPGLVYTGETTAPGLAQLEVQRTDGMWISAGGAIDVSGATAVRGTFSEPIDPTSVSASTFGLSGVSGTTSVSGRVVTFTPSARLGAGVSYTIDVGAVADLAGNAFLGTNTSFTVETAVPTFDTVVYDATPTREAAYGKVILTFSEPVDPTTITVNTASGIGSVAMATPSALYGCATRDVADPRRIIWSPAEALAAGVAVDVTVNAPAAASTLTDMAGTAVGTTVRSFTP